MSTYEDRMEAHERLAWCADNPEIVDAMRAELFGPALIASGGDVAELRAIDHDINTRIELWLDQDRRISVHELNEWCRRIRALADRLASRSGPGHDA